MVGEMIIDRLLSRAGLMRTSQVPYESLEIEWKRDEPVHVDIKLKYGQRVVGAVDPWYPNKSPLFK